MTKADDYRREADHIENIARLITLMPDKRALLAEAQSLRRRAKEIEERSFDETAADAVSTRRHRLNT